MAEKASGLVLCWKRVCAGKLNAGKNLRLEPDAQAVKIKCKPKF